jgi:sugar phosphate permease
VMNPAAVATATRVRWKIFLLMLMLTSINYIDRTSLSVAMPLIGKEFNLDPAMQGLILSSFFWTYAFMQARSVGVIHMALSLPRPDRSAPRCRRARDE